MKFIIIGKNLDVTPGLKEAVESKLGKLERYFTPDTEIHVTLSVQRERQKIEVTIPVKGGIIRSEQQSSDMYVSIDSVLSKLEGQIRKHRTRLAKRMKRDADPIEVFAPDAEVVPQVVRTKRFKVEAMDVDDAISQMEMLGHSFFLYRDSQTDQICLVYTREDGNYGVLIPD